MNNVRSRIQSLDLIKIISMYCVIGSHVFIHCYENPIGQFFCNSIVIVGIPLFFMTSGYLMSYKTSTDVRYISRKIFGIIRFVTIIVLLDCLACLKPPTLHRLYDPYLQEGSYLAVFWYLGAMILIYLLLPLLLKVIHSRWHSAVLVLLGIIVICFFALNCYCRIEQHITQTYRLYNWFFYFLLGAWIRVKNFKFNSTWALFGMLCILTIFIYCLRNHYSEPFFRLSFLYGSPFCIAFVFMLFSYVKGLDIHDNRLISELSRLFLPVYALHNIFIFLILEKIQTTTDILPIPIIWYLLVASCVTAVSWLIMKTRVGQFIFRI